MTQRDMILEYIDRFGSISPMEAFSDLGITKLATRVSELDAMGIPLEKTWESRRNRFGKKVRYKRYSRLTNDGRIHQAT